MTNAPQTTTAADGTDIAYYDFGGDGPSVVLVHGITENATAWGAVAEALAADNHVVALDLRGHGSSATAATYDLASMAGDVVAVMQAVGFERPRLVGHSLGGVVVSAVGAAAPVESVVCVDQALALGAFQELLAPIGPMLRDPETFPAVMAQLFDGLSGPLAGAERERVDALRRPDQSVVLGVWDLILSSELADIEAQVDGALAPYANGATPYLALFGVDPGEDYGDWLRARIPGAEIELWPDQGHYPHLIDPDRFVDRLAAFWA